MIRVGICDDMLEETIRQKGMVERFGKRFGVNVEILIFEEGEELLQEIQTYGHIDILLLDIEMGGINGIETARIIRETDFQTVLIFISAYDQYCKEMISVQPFAFLDKPVKEKELEIVLKKVMEEGIRQSHILQLSDGNMNFVKCTLASEGLLLGVVVFVVLGISMVFCRKYVYMGFKGE